MTGWQMTAEQQEAVNCLDQDCIVAAGAGSGKTRVLVERFLSILKRHLSEKDPLSMVVAMTFTEKAATEMKHRVREGIAQEMRGAQEEGRSVEADQWYRILSDLERARISTIHSFCASLLREHPVEAMIDPDFRVLEELEAESLLKRAITSILPEWMAKLNPSVAMERLILRWGVAGTRERLAQLYQEMTGHGWVPEQLGNLTGKHLRETEKRLIKAEQKLLQRVLLAGDGMLTLAGGKLCSRFQEDWPRLKKELQSADYRMERVGLLLEIKGLLGGNWGRKEEILVPRDRLKEECLELQSVSDGVSWIKGEHEVVPFLLSAIKGMHQKYNEEKEMAGVLDFDDLQSRAVRLLQESSGVAQKVRGQIRYLMVDEYQDTNDFQKKLTDLLLPGPGGERIPGKWFVVGDAKQSIYRFRGADVSVFGRTRREIEESGGKEVALLDNFRSEASLVQFVNALFGRLMSSDPECDNYYRDTRAHRDPGEEEGRVEFLPIPERAKEAGDHRQWEATAIAKRIGELIEEGTSPQEIAILLQAMTHVKILENALLQAGIPYYVVKGDGFFTRQEILDVYHLLRYLADPNDRLALTGLLRSPFCGISDETLWVISRGEAWEKEWVKGLNMESLSPREHNKLTCFAELIAQWRRLNGRVTVAELLEQAVEESGYRYVSWAFPQGSQIVANVDKFLRLLRTWQREAPYSLQRVCKMINQWIQEGVRETEAKVETEDGASVKLMTIHQSKGLEFPVVFIPDLSRKLPPETIDVKADRECGLVFCLSETDLSRLETYRWRGVKNRESQLAREESLRLFYVAITRAEERIVFSGLPEEHRGLKKGGDLLAADTWSKWLDGVLGFDRLDREAGWWRFPKEDGPPLRLLFSMDEEDGRLEREEPALLDEWLSHEGSVSQLEDDHLPEHVLPRGWTNADSQMISVTDLTMLANCPRKFYYAKLLGLPEIGEGDPSEKSRRSYDRFRLDSRIKGQIVHRLLEILPPGPISSQEMNLLYHKTFAEWGIREEDHLQSVAEIAPLVKAYRGSRFYRDLSQLSGIKQEARFIGQTQGLEIEGIMDRIQCTPEGEWELVDYKTNDVTGEEVADAAAEYLPQVYLYALAAREEWGIQLARGILYFLKPDEQVEIEINEDWMLKARGRLDEWAQLLQRGKDLTDFTPYPGKRCTYCDYRLICEGAFE
ncbi:ATP-dependent helicase/nuclease subunit A [Marininema mesophilum]|uniref:DNA 3'-5' helicase n=1 Tax=Marininema mesophilum TaxID=1048340 RepID=A0A1H2VHC5_9BACL|nr:UvrD-helicase domain-containing protein [Marininema mesophilum]SDW67289.1 ATP-dependent helicase/nuclease subunit A [Marininema mesophilum]